jgi:hypothetical protein
MLTGIKNFTMRITYIFITLTFIFTGCGNVSNGQKQAGTGGAGAAQPNGSKTTAGTGSWEKLVMKQFKGSKGEVIAEVPYPASWTLVNRAKQGDPTITGPNGLKIMDFPLKSFMYSYDPGLQQTYYQSGMQMRPMPGVQQLMQQDIEPWGASQGLQLVKTYELPDVAKVDKWYNDQMFKAMPTETKVIAIGTDWKKADGTPYFAVIRLIVSDGGNMQSWYYMTTGLEAATASFEKAKKQLIFSLENTRYALEPIMEYNKQEAQRIGQSWEAFNRRMAQNQASFEASQRAHVNKTNAINDAIMSSYKSRDAAGERNQEQFVDMINEKTNTVDPSTGQKYKVESHYNHYWMNSDGEYISTNQNDYNPNLDENLNNQKWQQLKKVK